MEHHPRLTVLPVPRWLVGTLCAVAIVAAAQVFVEAQESAGAFSPVSLGQGERRPEVGAQAPEFTAVDLDGAPVRLSDYRGRPVWINFWATWCPPCRAELPEINAVYQDAQNQGLVLLAVSVSEDRATVLNYLTKTGYSIPAVLDDDGGVANRYAVSGLPMHVFIDKEGIVRDIRVGGLNQRAMREQLAAIMSP